MKILAIESSSLVAGIAILDDDIIVTEYNINYKMTHSQTLLPMLANIKEITNIDLNTIDAVAVCGGPGSFTGLRIGISTAKAVAMAINKPLVNVPTLEAMAYNFEKTEALIVPMLDARREQIYNAIYRKKDKLEIVKEQRALSIYQLIDELNQMQEDIIFLGDALPVYKEIIEKNILNKYIFAAPNLNRQRVASLACLAKEYYKNGKYCMPRDFKIEYLRKSQAQRQREGIDD